MCNMVAFALLKVFRFITDAITDAKTEKLYSGAFGGAGEDAPRPLSYDLVLPPGL